MLRDPRLRAALGFENDAILLDDFQMLLLPKRLVEEPPIGALPAGETAIPQKINQRAIFIDGRRKAEYPQDSLWTKRQRDVEANPHRVADVEFRPVEIHAALTLALHDKAVGRARGAHVVLECAA